MSSVKTVGRQVDGTHSGSTVPAPGRWRRAEGGLIHTPTRCLRHKE